MAGEIELGDVFIFVSMVPCKSSDPGPGRDPTVQITYFLSANQERKSNGRRIDFGLRMTVRAGSAEPGSDGE
jgi:hypothetical protein